MTNRSISNTRSTMAMSVLGISLGLTLSLTLSTVPILVATSGVVLTGSLIVMHRQTRLFSFRALSIPGFCYWNYLAIVMVPALFVFADQREPYRTEYLFAVESGLVTIPLGIVIVSWVSRFTADETNRFFTKPLRSSPTDPSVLTYSFVLALALLVSAVYLLEVRTVPLFYLIQHPGEYALLGRLREESGKLLESNFKYIYDLLKTLIYPFLVPLSFGMWLHTKQRTWGLLFCITLIAGVVYGAMTIQKSPVALIFVILCACYYVHKRGRVGLRFIGTFIALFLTFPIFVLTRQYAGEFSLLKALETFGHRLFYVPAEVLYYYFEVFPRVVPYQHGLTIDKVARLLGDQAYPAPNVVGRYMWPETFYSVSANAPFLGNLNADFGMIGVIVGGVVAGAVLQAVQVYIVRRGKSVVNLACYAVLMINFVNLNHTALPIVLMSDGTILVLLVAAAITTAESIVRRISSPGAFGSNNYRQSQSIAGKVARGNYYNVTTSTDRDVFASSEYRRISGVGCARKRV